MNVQMLSKETLQVITGTWADETFPKSDNESIKKHLQAEVEEFLDDESPEEAADVLLLLMHHAHKNGYDLLLEGMKKLSKNKLRVWETELNEDGYFKHIEPDNAE